MLIDRLRDELTWRWQLASRKRYLRRTFRNSEELIRSLVTKTPCDVAISNDGVEIRHPPARYGLALMILEVWFEQVYTHNFYSPRPGDTIIDAGANIGLFSLLMARREPKCRVFAFEPFEENFHILEANLQAAAAANISPFQIALSGETGNREMFDGGQRSQDHRLAEGSSPPAAQATAVPTASFADVLERAGAESIALFKCDIEGSEYDLFRMASDRDLRRVREYAIEFHNHIRPGTLDLLRNRLEATHDLTVRWDGPRTSGAYGMLYAKAKG